MSETKAASETEHQSGPHDDQSSPDTEAAPDPRTGAPDPETVAFMPTYRVGVLPPEPGSLQPGEISVELGDGSAAPKLWMGGVGDTVTAPGGGGISQADFDALEARVAALEAAAGGATASEQHGSHRNTHHRSG